MRVIQRALTFDDVLLLPAHSRVLPRDVSLKTRLTRKLGLNIPLISAAMDTVTEARLAIAIAQEGGIGIIHKNLSPADQAAEAARVKRFESGVVRDPVTVSPDITVRELLALTQKHKVSGFPVVEKGKVIGMVTNRDFRFETNLDAPVRSIMTPKERLIYVREGASPEEARALLHKHRIKLRGLITVKDILKSTEHPNACKDEQGKLRVGAAVGVGEGTEERIELLVEAGVDVIVVDTAHGHAQGVLDRVEWIKKRHPGMQVIGGNPITVWVLGVASRGEVEGGKHGGILVKEKGGRTKHEVLRGGTWIGYLERIAVVAAIATLHVEVIAAVIAIKGLGRFSELDSAETRERFIIGTLVSMIWAAACGALIVL